MAGFLESEPDYTEKLLAFFTGEMGDSVRVERLIIPDISYDEDTNSIITLVYSDTEPGLDHEPPSKKNKKVKNLGRYEKKNKKHKIEEILILMILFNQ